MLVEAVGRFAAGARRAVDATVGGGGHAAVLRERGAALLVVDRDHAAIAAAQARLGTDGVHYLEARFGDPTAWSAIAAFRPDLVLLDLGISSHQLADVSRGFSFQPEVPLDMRMTAGRGATAADLLNGAPLEELSRWFREYADERRARRLARSVARRRTTAPFATSDDLVNAVREALGPRAGPGDFARIFQAVRMAVNDELGELGRALPALLEALVPGGTLLIITYHSGEDRLVKQTFAEWARGCVCPPRQPVCTCRGRPLGSSPAPKGVRPDAVEVAANPRARSARLRVLVKADAA